MKKLKSARSEVKLLRERDVVALENQNKVNAQMLTLMNQLQTEKNSQAAQQYTIPVIHPAVVPNGKKAAIAQDSCGAISYTSADPQFYSGFLGYPALSMMSQSSDYRSVPETTANEMTREWGKVKVKGDGSNQLNDRIALIEERLKKLKIRDLIRKHVECEMIFGRSQLVIKIKGHENQTDVPLDISSAGIKKGALEGFVHVEPIWSTPSVYNAHDPLAEDFFKPSKWFVLGKEIHADRLLTLVMRPVSDMLKPAYNFSGLSMLQLMKPYVERWQRTVDSVSDLIKAFSITGLKTDMGQVLTGGQNGKSQLIMRAQLFSMLRDNLNTMLIDKEMEELFQINTPLTTLDALVQKAQEQLASPSHTPMVKLLGITPSGLNANSDGEIRVYNDWIASLQEAHIRPQMEVILNLIQLDLFGETDDSIVFEFNSLHQLNDTERANVNKAKADTISVLIAAGVISQEQAAQSLVNDEFSDFSGIDPEDLPEPMDLNHENSETTTDVA